MGGADETDIIREGLYKGYTWLEAYVFDEIEKLVVYRIRLDKFNNADQSQNNNIIRSIQII